MEISNFSDVLDCYPNIKSTKTISDDAKRVLSVLMCWYRKENHCYTSIIRFSQLAIVCRLSVIDMYEAIKLLKNLDFVKFSMLMAETSYSYEILYDNIKHYNDEITKYSEKEEIEIVPTPWNSRVCKTAERLARNYREQHNLTDK